MENLNMYLSLLFDPDEPVWFTKSYKGQLRAKSQQELLSWFKSSIKSSSIVTSDGMIVGLNPAKERDLFRCSESVGVFRNLLIEIDDMSLGDQMAFYERSGLPISARVFSGNRSIHAIISLQDPLHSIREYRELHEKIRIALCSRPDQTANPSQCTKMPDGHRMVKDEVKRQELISIGTRISRTDLEAFLAKHRKRIDTALKAKEMQRKLYADSDLVKADYGELINAYLAVQHHRAWSGHIRTACPNCRLEKKDSGGDHLSIDVTTGHFRCWAGCSFSDIVATMKASCSTVTVYVGSKI